MAVRKSDGRSKAAKMAKAKEAKETLNKAIDSQQAQANIDTLVNAVKCESMRKPNPEECLDREDIITYYQYLDQLQKSIDRCYAKVDLMYGKMQLLKDQPNKFRVFMAEV